MASVKEVDQATFQRLLATDPDVQAVIRRVWGDTPVTARPGDTPKSLEKANDAASKEISQILAAKGVQLPKHTFINPRTNSLEAEHGWAGLPTGVKIAIIAGGALATGGALGAAGAFGGAAGGAAGGAGGAAGAAGGAGAAGAAGAAIPSLAVATGLPAGLMGAGAAGGIGAGTAATAGGGLLSTIGKLAASKGVGALGDVLGKQQAGAAQGRIAEGQAQQGQDRNAISLYGEQQGAQNQAGSLDLQRKAYDASSRSSAGKQALLAMLMGDYKPSQVSVPGVTNATVSGGMGDTIKNNPQILALLKSIANKGATDQATPNTFTGGELVKPPSLTPLPQQSKGSSLLDTISKIAQVGGAVGAMRRPTGGF